MKTTTKTRARIVVAAALALATACAAAAPVLTVVQSTDYGLLTLPASEGFGLNVASMASDDTFLSDYGFSIGSAGSLTAAAVTVDLGNIFEISNLTVTLLQGQAWSGPTPTDLTPAQVADRASRIIVTGSGMPTAQTIDDMTLPAGTYTLEISGNTAGTSGGSFGGVLNVAAVPEPAALTLMFAGFGLLAAVRRRAGR